MNVFSRYLLSQVSYCAGTVWFAFSWTMWAPLWLEPVTLVLLEPCGTSRIQKVSIINKHTHARADRRSLKSWAVFIQSGGLVRRSEWNSLGHMCMAFPWFPVCLQTGWLWANGETWSGCYRSKLPRDEVFGLRHSGSQGIALLRWRHRQKGHSFKLGVLSPYI